MESSGDDRKAMDELVRGREFAKQLRQVINIDDDDDELAFAQHLVNNVLSSFTNTLFLLDKPHEVQLRDPSFIKSDEDSHESCKSKLRRGCYKRRKTTQTWEKVSETPTDDGHQWRKYGQKMILNAKYSRNYYRCTHKFDQRCQATKQVQRIQEKTPLYKTTYYGHHTCKTSLNPDIILDPTSPHDTSILLSFNNTFPTPTKQDCPFLSSSFSSPSVNEEVPSTSLDLDDYLLSPEPTLENSARHVSDGTLSSTLESHHKDVMYGVFYDSVELDDVFQPFVGF